MPTRTERTPRPGDLASPDARRGVGGAPYLFTICTTNPDAIRSKDNARRAAAASTQGLPPRPGRRAALAWDPDERQRRVARGPGLDGAPTPCAAGVSVNLPVASRFALAVSALAMIAKPASAIGFRFDLCTTVDTAVLAKAVDTRSFYQTPQSTTQKLPPGIVTEVTFQTETVFIGSMPTEFVQTYSGGRIGDEASSVSGTPRISVGDRWLFLFQQLPDLHDIRLLLFHYVSPEFQSPSTERVLNAWRSACASTPTGVYKGDRIMFDAVSVLVSDGQNPNWMSGPSP